MLDLSREAMASSRADTDQERFHGTTENRVPRGELFSAACSNTAPPRSWRPIADIYFTFLGNENNGSTSTGTLFALFSDCCNSGGITSYFLNQASAFARS